MNTLELQGRLMKLIANTEDKSLLEKMEAYLLTLVSSQNSSDIDIPEWHKDIVRKRVENASDKNFTDLDKAIDKLNLE